MRDFVDLDGASHPKNLCLVRFPRTRLKSRRASLGSDDQQTLECRIISTWQTLQVHSSHRCIDWLSEWLKSVSFALSPLSFSLSQTKVDKNSAKTSRPSWVKSPERFVSSRPYLSKFFCLLLDYQTDETWEDWGREVFVWLVGGWARRSSEFIFSHQTMESSER